MKLNALRACLLSLSAFRHLREHMPMLRMERLLQHLCRGEGEAALEAYADLFHTLRQAGYSGFGCWLWDVLRYEESPYSRLVESGGSDREL